MMWVESPIKQFEVKTLLPLQVSGVDLSFTNASLFMVLTMGVVLGGLWFAARKAAVVPDRVQSVGEVIHGFVFKMVDDILGEEGRQFFPFVFSLFAFIIVANLMGMIPHSFTVTSQIIVTFMFAMLVIGTVIVYGVWKNGLGFLKLFAPSGVPTVLLPLVAVIEVFSFLSRPVSLAIRLFANMLAGHIMLKVFAGFVGSMLTVGGFIALLSPLPLALTVAVTALEFLVSVLQAYVFALLTCVYLNDALHPGH